MTDLFEKPKEKYMASEHAPLADRMRPQTLSEFVGQKQLLSPGQPLYEAIVNDKMSSAIFWGPPGSGKTTLAYLIAAASKAEFLRFSAVTAGIKEIKDVIADVEKRQVMYGQKTILFIDEIHRFNKAQQDAFLPFVEKGVIILLGATTENPSFEVNSALLSRCRVFVLKELTNDEVKTIARRALTDKERGLGKHNLKITDEALERIAIFSDGDARIALSLLEFCLNIVGKNGEITPEVIEKASQKKALRYDKAGEEHYNIISALHKSVRDSDPDGALYWLARMLASGEDPLYVARRMVRMASEDIGNADPQALSVMLAAKDAYHFLGTPEGELALAQACIYLATAPKSNAVYAAFGKVGEDVEKTKAEPVPLHIRNAPTGLMKALGYGAGYKYAHDYEEHFVAQDHLPDSLKGRKYYHPSELGFEKEIKNRIERWEELKQKAMEDGKKRKKT
ncbi:MAG TPA: replication-associated recombination protein A [Verrucomicrobiae bacterium]|nr:replication-associated recombination protein A [Verrucomicrobiae bacterium]